MKKKGIQNSTVRKIFPFLKIVSKLPRNDGKKILKNLGGDELVYKTLRELSQNYLKGNIPLEKKLKGKDLKLMKKISSPNMKTTKCPCSKRAKYIQNGHGIFSILIPAVAGLLSTLISKK